RVPRGTGRRLCSATALRPTPRVYSPTSVCGLLYRTRSRTGAWARGGSATWEVLSLLGRWSEARTVDGDDLVVERVRPAGVGDGPVQRQRHRRHRVGQVALVDGLRHVHVDEVGDLARVVHAPAQDHGQVDRGAAGDDLVGHVQRALLRGAAV